MAEKKKAGRPSNKEKLAEGSMVVSKSCKICQSPVRNEITRDILNGVKGTEICEKYSKYFENGLSPTNVHSHKQHVSPEAVAIEDRKQSLAKVSEYDPITKQLFEHRYDKAFDKVRAADELYKQRLTNLFRIQHLIEEINATEERDGELSTDLKTQRAKLIMELEEAYRGFNQDLIKHIALDADLYVKQVSVQYIELIKNSILRFTQKFMDILVKEIDDKITQARITEQLGDLLDKEIAPNLDPQKAVDADFEVMENKDES